MELIKFTCWMIFAATLTRADVVPSNSDSCVGRCDDPLDRDYPCQCNKPCLDFGDCCEDYETACPAPEEVTQEELSAFVNNLWALDENRIDPTHYSIDKQGFIADENQLVDVAPNRLFTNFDESVIFTKPTYAAFLNILDNYTPVAEIDEDFTESILNEIDEFLDEILNTRLMIKTYNLLFSKGYMSNIEEFRAKLKEIWFTLYSRTSDSDSSGFEHVFAGEFRTSPKVNGFHNWLQFYLKEKEGTMNYYGYFGEDQANNVVEMQFYWENNLKQLTSIMFGVSPEFEMAIFSTCFIIDPNTVCRFTLNDMDIGIQTYDLDKYYVGTAYWVIS